MQAPGATCILTKPQRASTALCSPWEARGIPKHTKGNSELFFPLYSFSFGGSCGSGEFQFEVFFLQDKQRGCANSYFVSCFILTPQDMCSCELFNSQPLFQVSTDCFSQDCRKYHCAHTYKHIPHVGYLTFFEGVKKEGIKSSDTYWIEDTQRIQNNEVGTEMAVQDTFDLCLSDEMKSESSSVQPPLPDPKQPWWLPALFLFFFPSSFLWETVHQVRLLSFAMDHCREPHAFLIKLPAQQPCCRRNKYARNRKQVVVYLWPFRHASSSVSVRQSTAYVWKYQVFFSTVYYRARTICCLVSVQGCSTFP